MPVARSALASRPARRAVSGSRSGKYWVASQAARSAILFAFALQMIALGVLGEYIGRMYQEVKGRPIDLVRDRVGFRD